MVHTSLDWLLCVLQKLSRFCCLFTSSSPFIGTFYRSFSRTFIITDLYDNSIAPHSKNMTVLNKVAVALDR